MASGQGSHPAAEASGHSGGSSPVEHSPSLYPASASQLSVGGCYFAREAVGVVNTLVNTIVMISGDARCGGLLQ